jgi:hypothetical protein
MIGRDSDFDAGGVGVHPPVGDATGGLVRPLGAFEPRLSLAPATGSSGSTTGAGATRSTQECTDAHPNLAPSSISVSGDTCT